jgi:hypothetical protein
MYIVQRSLQKLRTQCVSGRGWGEGVLSCVGDHIQQEFNTLFLTRIRTYKIARPPQTKNLGGEGALDR